MFKFGFSSDEKENNTDEITKSNENEIKWNKSIEIIAGDSLQKIEDILSNTQVNTLPICEVEIKYLCSNQVLTALQKERDLDASVLRADQSHSDLLPGVYEGGLKIWECTFDLLNFIDDTNLNLAHKKVLDLGCGAGIVGILSLVKGSRCYFQDYNADVLQYITIPNVLLNSKENLKQCKFYSGDWRSFHNLLQPDLLTEDDKFDYMFTCETIYNTENYPKLHQVFETLLKKSGVIFLAAKSFYFGVGGGISLFEDFLIKSKVFKYSSCWKCVEGVNREILKIEFNC